MPTIIALDTSFSMGRTLLDTGDSYTSLQLAVYGINTLLDYLNHYCKLEFVALLTFSSLYELISPFTRDFDTLKVKLQELEEGDKTNLEPVLNEINRIVLTEWGSTTACQVILVTDGFLENYDIDSLMKPGSPLPFTFPGSFSIVNIGQPGSINVKLKNLLQMCGNDGSIFQVDSVLSQHFIHKLFLKLADKNYASFSGFLKCGHLSSKIMMSPVPMPYTKVSDFEYQTYSIGNEIEVCGFLEVSQVGSPAAISRHLVLPYPSVPSKTAPPLLINKEKDENDSEDESLQDEGKTPSFCVLLHGALKVENMAALCQVGVNWFGILYSWADSKKKSNLMLTLLEPGNNPVPWLGDLTCLGVPKDYENPSPEETFPVRPAEKRSYSQNCVVWIRQGLQSDIHKILRHARKLPEKIQHFYKELNRVRRAAISLGFMSLLDGLAAILERECTILPGGAHPDCALQLTHAAGVLRKPYSRDPKYNVLPMRTKFSDAD